MFDIERINITKCMESGCKHYRCERREASYLPNPSRCSGSYYTVRYCELTVYERFQKCPLFHKDINRIAGKERFEVHQITNSYNGKITYHIYDNVANELITCIDAFEDEDKANELCEWLNIISSK